MADVSPEFEEWVQRARDVDIRAAAERIGAKLKRSSGSEWVGGCPACGGTDKFSVNLKEQIFNCGHEGGPGGNVIAMVMHCTGLDFMQAVEDLTGEPPPRGEARERDPEIDRERREERRDEEIARDREERARRARKIADAEAVWSDRRSFAGSHADAYLRRRGLVVTGDQALDLAFHPSLPYHGYRTDDREAIEEELGVFPAMLAAIRDVDGELIGVHRTFLDSREPKKLIPPGDRSRNKAKKFLGQPRGGAIWLGPPCSDIVMGEGIETTLSWMRMERGWPDREITPIAGLSIGNMCGGAMESIPHRNSPRRHVPNGIPDPDKPGVVLPRMVERLVMLMDGDSDPVWTIAMMATGARRFASMGIAVQIDRADPKTDFNDMLRQELAHG